MPFFPTINDTSTDDDPVESTDDTHSATQFVTPLKARRAAFIESKMQRITERPRDTTPNVVIHETEKGEFSLHEADRDIRRCIDAKKDAAPEYRRRIAQLEWIRDNTTDTIERKDAIDEIFRIQKKIDRFESGDLAREYTRSVQPIFDEYERLLQTPVTSGFFSSSKSNCASIKARKRALLSQFVQTASKYVKLTPPKSLTHPNTGKMCPNPECASTSFETDDNDTRYCTVCHTCVQVFDDTPAYRDKDRLNMSKRFRYSCERHFRDAYDRYQAKQNNTVPADVFTRIHEFIDQNTTITRSNITHRQILIVLSMYPKFAKYYEDVWLIHTIVTGHPPPDISAYHDRLFDDYKRQQDIADDIKVSKARKNSLNVYYILCRLLQKNDYKCKLRDFYCLKTDETREDHDRVWTARCKRLDWPVILE